MTIRIRPVQDWNSLSPHGDLEKVSSADSESFDSSIDESYSDGRWKHRQCLSREFTGERIQKGDDISHLSIGQSPVELQLGHYPDCFIERFHRSVVKVRGRDRHVP